MIILLRYAVPLTNRVLYGIPAEVSCRRRERNQFLCRPTHCFQNAFNLNPKASQVREDFMRLHSHRISVTTIAWMVLSFAFVR